MEQRAVMEGILQYADAVLLLQRAENETYAGQWQPPAGKVELEESPVDALVREYYEETGLSVSPLEPVNVQDYVVDERHSIIISYRVDTTEPFERDDVVLSSEHQAYDWVDPETAVQSEDYPLVGSFADTARQL